MPKPVPLPPGFDGLSVVEKIDYLQSLWERVAASPETPGNLLIGGPETNHVPVWVGDR